MSGRPRRTSKPTTPPTPESVKQQIDQLDRMQQFELFYLCLNDLHCHVGNLVRQLTGYLEGRLTEEELARRKKPDYPEVRDFVIEHYHKGLTDGQITMALNDAARTRPELRRRKGRPWGRGDVRNHITWHTLPTWSAVSRSAFCACNGPSCRKSIYST
jgi:hypothetical protein